MLFPSLKEVLQLSEMYSVIPVFWELPADHWSPLQIYTALSRSSGHTFLLEGISKESHFHRWSYIGSDPHLLLRVCNGTPEISAFDNPFSVVNEDPGQLVQKLLNGRRSPVFEDMPEFTGGFAGFCCPSEPLCCTFGLYDEIIAYDHLKSTAMVILNIQTGSEITAQYQAAEIRAAQLAAEIEGSRLHPQFRDDAPPICVERNGTEASVKNAPDSFELYRRMRSRFPSPHLFFCKEKSERLAAVCAPADGGEGILVGYRGYNGSVLELVTDQSVHYAEANSSYAVIGCKKDKDVHTILELMRAAKLENTSM